MNEDNPKADDPYRRLGEAQAEFGRALLDSPPGRLAEWLVQHLAVLLRRFA